MFSTVTGRATGKQKDAIDDDISITSSQDEEYSTYTIFGPASFFTCSTQESMAGLQDTSLKNIC
jgi:hypothetical protein